MNALSLLFHLGVLFSAFAFLWFWIQLLIHTIWPSNPKFKYFLKLLHSLFLGTLVLKFLQETNRGLEFNGLLLLALLTYFLYLIKNIQAQNKRIQVYSNLIPNSKAINEWEWTVAWISLFLTTLWIFYPTILNSSVSQWFYDETSWLIQIPIIGWFFKIAGFFFMLGMLLRFVFAFLYLLQPKKPIQKNEDAFDDYEEL